MQSPRIRDMALGFLLCLALFGSYYCGSMSPTIGSLDYAVVGGLLEDHLAYVVVDKNTGQVIFSEKILSSSLGTHDGNSLNNSDPSVQSTTIDSNHEAIPTSEDEFKSRIDKQLERFK